jgi:hypothetical protein
MDPIAEIKQLYHSTTRATIQRDVTRAVALLKSLPTEDARESVAVYMDGLSQMRSEWGVRPGPEPVPGSKGPKGRKRHG